MADTPAKESALNQFQAEEALVNLLDNSKATGNEEQKSSPKEETKSDDPQELTPDDLDLVSEETTTSQDEALYDVKVNGKNHKVTLDELMKGYSKDSDYRQKSARLSEDRKSVEEERLKIRDQMNVANQEREKYVQRLNELSKTLKEPEIDEAELNRLFEEDPADYVRKQAEINKLRDEKTQIKINLEEEKRKNNEVYQQKLQSVLEKEQQLLVDKNPIFGDPVKGEKVRHDITKFLRSKGFEDSDLNRLTDHRTVILAYDAMRMEQLRTAKLGGKKVKRVPKVATTSRSHSVDESEMRPMDKALHQQRKFSNRGNNQATKDAMKAWLEASQK